VQLYQRYLTMGKGYRTYTILCGCFCFLLVITLTLNEVESSSNNSSSSSDTGSPPPPKIKHVVVMMLENRAFDHMLGYYGMRVDTRVDGLTGKECNLKNISNPLAGTICVNENVTEVCAYDPNHSFEATTERIFGCHWNVTAGTPCTEITSTTGNNDMSGFVSSARREGRDGTNEMSMWPPEKIPIMTTLAQEYALFDRFFASYPGSTYPNRQFVLSGTAHGMTNTGDQVPKGGFPQKTILRSLEEAGLQWKMYYEDSLAWSIFLSDLQRNESKPFIKPMHAFYTDVEKGGDQLANFIFLEPRIAPAKNLSAHDNRTYGLPNHQHPIASVLEGERWIKEVYESLRKGPNWNETLLLITYDEHGGFYDHVPPPQTGVPNPDGICTKDGFAYERLGIRIPTLAISPWIQKNVLVHQPPDEQKPFPTSEYELSSIPATLRKIFPELDPSPLSKRDAWSGTFEHLLTHEYRDDCLEMLPELSLPPPGERERLLDLEVDEHAKGLIQVLCDLVHVTENDNHAHTACGAEIKTYHDFSPWVKRIWSKFIDIDIDRPSRDAAGMGAVKVERKLRRSAF